MMLPVKSFTGNQYSDQIFESAFIKYLMLRCTVDHVALLTKHLAETRLGISEFSKRINNPALYMIYIGRITKGYRFF